MRKGKHREVKSLAWRLRATKLRSWSSKPGLLILLLVFYYSPYLKEGNDDGGSRSEVIRDNLVGAKLRLGHEPGQDRVGER